MLRIIFSIGLFLYNPALAGFHGGGNSVLPPNGLLSMGEFGSGGGADAFIDYNKQTPWQGDDTIGTNTGYDPTQLNQYGNPKSTANFTTPWIKSQYIPVSGPLSSVNWVWDWVGTLSGKLTLNLSYVSIVNGPGGSDCANSNGLTSGTLSGTNCEVTVTPNGTDPVQFQINSVTTDNWTQRFYPITYGPVALGGNGAIDNCSTGITNNSVTQIAAYCFMPQQVAVAAVHGATRFINVQNQNVASNTSVSSVAWWADETPTTWENYRDYIPLNTCSGNWSAGPSTPSATCILTTNPFVNTSGISYTLKFPGFVLGDKAHIIVAPGATISAQNAPLTSYCSNTGSCPGAYTLTFSGGLPTGTVTGQLLYGTGILESGVTISAINSGTNTITIICTAIVGSCVPVNGTPSGTFYFSPMLEILDGSGTPITGYIPMVAGDSNVSHGTGIVIKANYGVLTYDSDLTEFITNYAGSSSTNAFGLLSGWPPIIMDAFAIASRTNPWFNFPYLTMDEPTDFALQLATFNKAELPSSYVPRYEGPDETWNFSSYPWYYYAINKEQLRYASNFNRNWTGRIMAQAGYTVAHVYNPSATKSDPTKYRVLGSIQTAPPAPVIGGSNQDAVFSSPEFVTNGPAPGYTGGYPAYDYETDIAITGYWGSGWDISPNNIAWAYAYSLGPSVGTGCADATYTQEKLICLYLNDSSLGNPTTVISSTSLANITFLSQNIWPEVANYAASYVGTTPNNLGILQYEGAEHEGELSANRTVSVLSVSTGSTTTLTVEPSFNGYISNGSGASGYNLTVTTAPTLGSLYSHMGVTCSGCTAGTFVVAGSSNGLVVPPQLVGSSGSPVAMSGDSEMDIICNTLSLCGASGPSYTGNPTMSGSNFNAGTCAALNANNIPVISTTPTTIVLDVNTTGDTCANSTGTLTYDNSQTYQTNFSQAVSRDAQVTPLELTNLQNYYGSGAVACPPGDTCPSPNPYVPINTRYPAMYDYTGDQFNKYWTNIWSSIHPVVNAYPEFDAAP